MHINLKNVINRDFTINKDLVISVYVKEEMDSKWSVDFELVGKSDIPHLTKPIIFADKKSATKFAKELRG